MYIWNYDFSVVSFIVILVIILFYGRRGYLPLRRNIFYHMFLWGSIIMISLDMFSTYMISNYEKYSSYLVVLVTTVFFYSVAGVVLVFFCYNRSMCNHVDIRKHYIGGIYYLPAVITFFACFLNIFFRFMFDVNEVTGYEKGRFYNWISMYIILYSILGIFITELFRKSFTWNQRASFIISWIILGTGSVIRTFFPKLMVVNVAMSLILLILYLSHQNPEYYLDRATGLYNDYAFRENVDVWTRYGTPGSIIGVSIGGYEDLRRMYGGPVIEEVKREIAEYLKKVAAKNPVFYMKQGRYSIIYKGNKDGTVLANDIRSHFQESMGIIVDGRNVLVRVRPVIVYYPTLVRQGSAEKIRRFLLQALRRVEDSQLYEVVPIDADMIGRMNHYLLVEKALEKAIEEKSVKIYYQPVFSASQKRVTSCEALARIEDEEIGPVLPDEFITVAEQNGSIIELGGQIFEKVCLFLRKVDIKKFGIQHIQINLSFVQCQDERIIYEFLSTLKKYKIDPSLICLEATEKATAELMKNEPQVQLLKDKGIIFSLDDFGVGYSNIVELFKFPVSIVKIDKSIIWAYFDGTNKILEDIIPFFHKNKVEVVAQGVEYEEMNRILIRMGCDYLQGFYFSKPIPESDFLPFVLTNAPPRKRLRG